ncbi:hypothetical protein IGS61_03515 [Janthinobacterium sp. FW305-129]|uniref:putative type VI secretion system effector n=1 Tax=Janthinobacterium sp. FW305-129 TaxID=2775054 RepID=UPI001E546F77|nr:putative type VI secretion system effector [Janthinobacterium sp. FW305-129]MCC7596541.1 hypothetical protein [Janthinobacterium sp. FW305-129]
MMNNMNDIQYSVVTGFIDNLNTHDVNVNYLKGSEKFKKTAGLTAVLQAAAGEPGAVHSAQAATSDGDPVTSFRMSVAGKSVSGSFWEVDFKEGDEVQVVGYARNSDFIAVAVVDLKEKKIWMRPHCERGTTAKKYHLLKCSGYFCVGLYILTLGMGFFGNIPLWLMLITATVTAPVILFATIGLSWSDFMDFSKEMNRVGKALGIVYPEKIDLFKSTRKSRKSGKPALPMGVYYL